MNIRDMTDRKVYLLVLEVLLDNLGPVGLKRFLQYSQISRGVQAAARYKWVERMEAETIAQGMQELAPQQPQSSLPIGRARSELWEAIHEMTDPALYQFGLHAIGEQLGAAALMKFGRLCKPGTGDATVARRNWLDTVDKEEFLARMRQKRENNPLREKE